MPSMKNSATNDKIKREKIESGFSIDKTYVANPPYSLNILPGEYAIPFTYCHII